MVEDSYGLLAGLGVRIAGYLQDLSQLQRDYPRSWETFISNSSVVGLLQCADQTTAKYFSEYLGNGTIEVNQGWSMHTRPRDTGKNPNDVGLLRSMTKGAFKNVASAPGAGMSYNDTPQQAQRFLSVFDPIATHFRTHRHRISAARNRALREIRMAAWNNVAGLNS